MAYKRFQNTVMESKMLLPMVAVVMAASLYLAGVVEGGWWIQTICLVVSTALLAELSSSTLVCSDTYDVASVRLQMTDQNGNVLPSSRPDGCSTVFSALAWPVWCLSRCCGMFPSSGYSWPPVCVPSTHAPSGHRCWASPPPIGWVVPSSSISKAQLWPSATSISCGPLSHLATGRCWVCTSGLPLAGPHCLPSSASAITSAAGIKTKFAHACSMRYSLSPLCSPWQPSPFSPSTTSCG